MISTTTTTSTLLTILASQFYSPTNAAILSGHKRNTPEHPLTHVDHTSFLDENGCVDVHLDDDKPIVIDLSITPKKPKLITNRFPDELLRDRLLTKEIVVLDKNGLPWSDRLTFAFEKVGEKYALGIDFPPVHYIAGLTRGIIEKHGPMSKADILQELEKIEETKCKRVATIQMEDGNVARLPMFYGVWIPSSEISPIIGVDPSEMLQFAVHFAIFVFGVEAVYVMDTSATLCRDHDFMIHALDFKYLFPLLNKKRFFNFEPNDVEIPIPTNSWYHKFGFLEFGKGLNHQYSSSWNPCRDNNGFLSAFQHEVVAPIQNENFQSLLPQYLEFPEVKEKCGNLCSDQTSFSDCFSDLFFSQDYGIKKTKPYDGCQACACADALFTRLTRREVWQPSAVVDAGNWKIKRALRQMLERVHPPEAPLEIQITNRPTKTYGISELRDMWNDWHYYNKNFVVAPLEQIYDRFRTMGYELAHTIHMKSNQYEAEKWPSPAHPLTDVVTPQNEFQFEDEPGVVYEIQTSDVDGESYSYEFVEKKAV